jgi:hypothetical protein
VALLRELGASDRLFNHCAVVGEIAAFIGAAMTRHGATVDAGLAEAAAVLHDLDKALPAHDPLRSLGHGAAGAEWLRRRDFGDLAEAVAAHPVFVLGEATSYADWAAGKSLETKVVAYADKRGVQELVSLDARFERWYARYPDSLMLRVAHDRARELEREVCAAAGLAAEDVARLPWVDAAIRVGAAR